MLFVGCSKSGENEEASSKIDPIVEELSRALFGTSWLHYKTIDGSRESYSNGHVFTFTDEVFGENMYWYSFDGIDCAGPWSVSDVGVELDAPLNTGYYLSAMEMGALISQCCVENAMIVNHTTSELVLQEGDKKVYFKSVASPDNGNGSGNTSDDYEKPDIGFYDFSATKTSVKVQYKIYNKDKAKVSSAKVYYGTNSNPSDYKSASVSGVMITANLSGLKAGTTYYVKCVATGKGGTTTTSVTKVITNY